MLTMLVNLLGCQLPGLGTILVDQNLRFLRPIMVGDTATFKITVERKYERTQHVPFDAEVILESGLRAITGTLEVLAPSEKIIRPRVSVPEVILSNRDERLQAFLDQAKGLVRRDGREHEDIAGVQQTRQVLVAHFAPCFQFLR